MTNDQGTEYFAGYSGRRRSWARPAVSLIGSFHRHYEEIRAIASLLLDNGFSVPSPSISRIIDPDACYVRFECDPPDMSDHGIQAATLACLLASDAVYVFAPDGYIGLDTSMEIGHLLQAQTPLFFSTPIKNVTMSIDTKSVLSPGKILEIVQRKVAGHHGARLTSG